MSEQVAVKMKTFRCSGGNGCGQTGCVFMAPSIPEYDESHGIYICPFNHWRTAGWVEIKNVAQNKKAKR